MLQRCIVIMGLERPVAMPFHVEIPFKEITVNNAKAIRTPQAIPCPEATDLDSDYHPCTKMNRRAVLLITILGSSLAFMDGSL